ATDVDGGDLRSPQRFRHLIKDLRDIRAHAQDATQPKWQDRQAKAAFPRYRPDGSTGSGQERRGYFDSNPEITYRDMGKAAFQCAFPYSIRRNLVFDQPTIQGLSAAIDALRQDDLSLNQPAPPPPSTGKAELDYAADYEALASSGGTGFLGSFILAHLLGLDTVCKVICLVRGKNESDALERLRSGSSDRGVWQENWIKEGKLVVVVGDLSEKNFGVDEQIWDSLCDSVDAVVHNGALVHWVYPYSKLRGPNVLGTLTAMELASNKRPKLFSFVSSTSAIDTEYYVRLSESKPTGVPEDDDLEGARTGLRVGYGQSKWVSEKLIMEAGKRGLYAHIVRPGYVLGHSYTAMPNISNTVNMVPVDYVAGVTAVSGTIPPKSGVTVLHIAARPPITFNDIFTTLVDYGYDIAPCDYIIWRGKLEQHVLEVQDNALYPLLHFVLDDLPRSTKAPELDITNTNALFDPQTLPNPPVQTVDQKTTGLYLSWLINAGFLEKPEKAGTLTLPTLTGVAKAVGRSGQ
ncbi:10279_t:CDS:2, partial [Acaulospora colombiana]